ncbi:hypothetical protein AWB69_07534 [Caballeronia udeis]|uniref:Uncharacterized protein n=1 Tax=Caballeronia udeis TaxID=1232866 RepID=A0A158JCZ5_9BURK|nr:hypothetical protein AWB69_07534 [Caballeronia udeis]
MAVASVQRMMTRSAARSYAGAASYRVGDEDHSQASRF